MKIREIRPALLDQAERIVFVVLYLFFAVRMTKAFLADGQVVQLIYLVDQFIVLAFLLCRRQAKNFTMRPMDWFTGSVGTCVPLLIGNVSPDAALAPPVVSASLSLFGTAVHLLAKMTLRRSFGAIAANRGIKATGPYKYVRHPMYLGYILSQTGLLLAGPNIRNVSVIAICWIFFFLRMEAEERLLSEDAAYQRFIEQTPFRLIPRLY